MRSERTMEMAAVAGALLIGGFLFMRAVGLSGAIPDEFRSASPGFGWAWDFDYTSGMADAGRLGEAPWPWPAKASGGHLLLPLDQALNSNGLKLTYLGLTASDRFRLDVGIASLDSSVTYPQDFGVVEARQGMTIDGRRFFLESITPLYVRLRAADR